MYISYYPADSLIWISPIKILSSFPSEETYGTIYTLGQLHDCSVVLQKFEIFSRKWAEPIKTIQLTWVDVCAGSKGSNLIA